MKDVFLIFIFLKKNLISFNRCANQSDDIPGRVKKNIIFKGFSILVPCTNFLNKLQYLGL